jgi:DNA polymerase-1
MTLSANPAPSRNENTPEASQPAERVFLLDAMSYIFRAYHALPRLTNRHGMATQAVYGLHNMLRKLMAEYQPEHVAAAFDLEGPTFRHESFADYKANRTEMPDELAQQLPYIRTLLDAMHIPIVEHPGYEADDVIGTLARQAAERGLDVLIVSSDKDMMQLVGGRVSMINPMKQDLLYDRERVIEKLGVAPEQVPDLMALQGDAVDNIPGAPGIGEKGARELIQKYGRVEACLEHAAEVSRKKYRESLQNHRDQILLSKQLATIDANVPVEFHPEETAPQEPDPEKLRELFLDLGFTSLLRELVPVAEAISTDYSELTDEESLRRSLESFAKDAVVAVAAGVPESSDMLAAISQEVALSPKPGVARTVPAALLQQLKPWVEDSAIPKAVHDSKAAHRVLARQGVALQGVRHDTLLYSFLLDATESSHSLGAAVERRFGKRPSGSLAEEADWAGRLATALAPEIREAGLERVYQDIELPLAPVLAEMESDGIKLDVAQLARLSAQMETNLEKLQAEIFKLTGTEFNINSPKQLGEVLFEKMGLPAPRKRGKSKSLSTAVDVLEYLAEAHEAPRRVLEYRQLAKLKSTYVDALPALVHPSTGRIHTTYNQAGAATGRLSSSNPNLQNIPIRTELGREIRAAFIADKGCVLVAADYSQIELRLLAHFSEDALLIEAFRNGDDIHELTATAVFGVPPEEQTLEHRRRAKAINYGVVYGISPFGLAQQIGAPQKEAEAFINQYFDRYEGVRRFIEATIEEVRRTLEVRTFTGRRRRIPDITSRDYNARSFAERAAVNTPLQGGAADLIKLAMLRVQRHLRASGLRSRMILQVHDELVLEAPREEAEQAAAVLREGMEQASTLRVPLVAEVAAGPNWRDMDEIKESGVRSQ